MTDGLLPRSTLAQRVKYGPGFICEAFGVLVFGPIPTRSEVARRRSRAFLRHRVGPRTLTKRDTP